MNTENLTVEQRAKKIKIAVFDIDGVMTSGALGLGDDGQEYKFFHSQDGLGLKMLRNTGLRIGVVTGRTSQLVIKRAANIGAEYIFQGCDDKLEAFNALLKQANVTAEECLFMGDDVIDIPPMRRCGLAVTVPHGMPLVKEYAHYVTTREAGFGAVREVAEIIMRAQGTFDGQMAYYLR